MMLWKGKPFPRDRSPTRDVAAVDRDPAVDADETVPIVAIALVA